MKKTTLAVLGCGNMAQAIVRALYKSQANGSCTAYSMQMDVIVSDIDEQKLVQLDAPVAKTTDNADAVRNADYVLLAVKPQAAVNVLQPLSLGNKIVISIMAGTSIATLQQLTGCRKVIRVMPNLNARIFRSYNAYACVGVTSDEQAFVQALLSSFGVAEQVEEAQLDAVTGLTGSSPAFVFMFIKALAEQGVALGFSPASARKMALATVIGSAELVNADPTADLDRLIDSVCSKGGTTIEGVNYLRAQNFETVAKTAVQKAVDRAMELSASK